MSGLELSNITKKEVLREMKGSLFEFAVSALTKDPAGAIMSLAEAINSGGSVRDAIFYEAFVSFLENTYPCSQGKAVEANVKALSIKLAEASPNPDAGYAGNPEVLNEYAKRVIMAIDECGTVQKSVYISNLARAVLNDFIDTKTFFKLCKCVLDLTEEDLVFIKRNITKDTIETDENYIDDFRALGLMKEVNGGFDYTERAFLLRNYALDYEGQNDMPESFRERQITAISSDEEVHEMIKGMFKENKDEIVKESVEKSKLKWELITEDTIKHI